MTYSSLIHIMFLGWFVFSNLNKLKTKTYYAVDFMGGLPQGGGRKSGARETPKEEDVKTKIVNPEEDLLLKSKNKSKKVKEIISRAPPVPSTPIPKSPSGSEASPSAIPLAIPDSGSGIGIGFGDGGYGSGQGAGNFPYAWYVHTVRKKLDSNWNVAGGFSTRIYAQVVFTIKRDGSLADIEVEESSKNDVFDRAALRAVQTSSPLAPLPSGFDEPALRVHVRFTVKR
jgi:TonB family protein